MMVMAESDTLCLDSSRYAGGETRHPGQRGIAEYRRRVLACFQVPSLVTLFILSATVKDELPYQKDPTAVHQAKMLLHAERLFALTSSHAWSRDGWRRLYIYTGTRSSTVPSLTCCASHLATNNITATYTP
jgi:hypothetical protein